jgi:hypothetical protein
VTGPPILDPRLQPGWKPDPTGRFDERYFIRGSWTRRVRWGDHEAIDAHGVDDPVDPGDDPPWPVVDDGCGWRPDPTRRFPERWWDGSRYTRKVRVGQAVATDVVGNSATRGRASRRQGDEAGWRPDPDGPGERWWDGHEWTAKHRDAAAVSHRHSMRGWWSRTVLLTGVIIVAFGLVVTATVLVVLALF